MRFLSLSFSLRPSYKLVKLTHGKMKKKLQFYGPSWMEIRPTERFTILVHQNPSFGDFYTIQNRRLIHFAVQKTLFFCGREI